MANFVLGYTCCQVHGYTIYRLTPLADYVRYAPEGSLPNLVLINNHFPKCMMIEIQYSGHGGPSGRVVEQGHLDVCMKLCLSRVYCVRVMAFKFEI